MKSAILAAGRGFRSEKMQEYKTGIRRDRPEEVTLGRLCKDFLKTWNPAAKEATVELYESTVQRLLNSFGIDCLIRSIGPRQADRFLASQTHYIKDPAKELSEWTRLQITRHCKTIFGVAV